jgi:DNA-binding beta-propeller fold protein YncE
MLNVCVKSISKRGVLMLVLVALTCLGPVSVHADKKKKQPADASAAPPAPVPMPDFGKVVFPPPPAPTRLRYLDYFSAEKPDESKPQPKPQKKGWMDRLAGVSQDTNRSASGQKLRFHLVTPYGVAVDSKGLLYVADSKVGAVFIFNTENNDLTMIKHGRDARFNTISGLAIDDADHLFVADSAGHVVLEFDANHKLVDSFGAGILREPCGIAVDSENRFMYVVDVELDQVIVFDADSRKVVRRIGTAGKDHTLTGPGDFSKPTFVALDKDGNAYITDTLNDRVEVFDADGNFIRAFGKNGDGAGDFARPKGIAIDSDGHVWVADAMLNRLQVFTPEGRILMAMGSFGIEPGQFQALTGVAFDAKNHRIFTAEQMYARVQMFRYYTDEEAKVELEKRREERAKEREKRLSGAAETPAPVTAASATGTPAPAAPASAAGAPAAAAQAPIPANAPAPAQGGQAAEKPKQ